MKKVILFFFLSFAFIGANCNGLTPEPPTPPTPTPPPTPEPPAACSTYYGMDFFAAANSRFPCATALTTFDGVRCPIFGYLWGTFGDDHGCLYRFFQENKFRQHAVRIHLTNEVCRRHENCKEGEPFPNMSVSEYDWRLKSKDQYVLQVLRQRLNNIAEWLRVHSNANTEVIISDGLESNYSEEASKTIQALIHEQGWKASWNSMSWSGGTADAEYAELHSTLGLTGQYYIHAQDGKDIRGIPGEQTCYPRTWSVDEVRRYASGARGSRAVMLWHGGSQGLATCPPGWVDPRWRQFSFSGSAAGTINAILVGVSHE